MIAVLALLLQVTAALPPTIVIRAGTHTTTLPIVTTHAVPYVAARKLTTALGGTWQSPRTGHYTMILGEAHIDLTDGDPFARVDSAVVPLAAAPTLVDGTLYVPFQLAAEIIPRLVTGFIYDPEADEIRAFNTAARQGIASSASPPVSSSPPPEPEPSEPMAPADDDNAASDPPSTPPPTSLHRHHIVIVDAGHGGVDNGMTGPIGSGPKIYEKNITLTVAKLVARDLRDQGIEVVMTRTTDTLIALADRGRIANSSHGDVFVSIHVNATGSRGSDAAQERGYETYFLAEAKTEDARRVEKMENEAVRFETGVNAPKGDPLKYILNDMAQNEHLRESDELAQFVQNSFRAFRPPSLDRGVQQANFAVLRGSYMPAVLIEIGFGTNPSEAAFISNATNQHTIAHSITASVMKYLGRYEARTGAAKRPKTPKTARTNR